MSRAGLAWSLLILGAVLITVDLLVASSSSLRATLVRLYLLRRFPRLSLGFVTVLMCALGVAVIAEGLAVMSAP
jgi:threonine/homoserine/homoserine lactone efflux protein